jgi:taurine dioxygenase
LRGHLIARLELTRLTGSIGAIVEDLQLRMITADEFTALQLALLEHQVLFIRNQAMDEREHLAFVQRWAEPMVFPVGALVGRTNPISVITDDADSPPDADGWHTDITWWPEPPSIAVLAALSVPDAGGDTLWVDLHRAYESLAPPERAFCEERTVFHAPGERFIAANARSQGEELATSIREHLAGAHHPLVRSHPITGRPALFLGGGFMQRVDGMEQADSDALLERLGRLLDDPNRQVRWRWREGDVAIWDEANTNHRALSDHYPQLPQMRRCTAKGERPWFSPDGTPEHATIRSYPERNVDPPTR